MNVDIYIFLRFVVIFSEFFKLSISVLRVSSVTDPSRRDRSVSVPAESAAETATVNHDQITGMCRSMSGVSCVYEYYQKIRLTFPLVIIIGITCWMAGDK